MSSRNGPGPKAARFTGFLNLTNSNTVDHVANPPLKALNPPLILTEACSNTFDGTNFPYTKDVFISPLPQEFLKQPKRVFKLIRKAVNSKEIPDT